MDPNAGKPINSGAITKEKLIKVLPPSFIEQKVIAEVTKGKSEVSKEDAKEIYPVVDMQDYKVDLDLSSLSPEVQHFLSQWNVTIKSQIHDIKIGQERDILLQIRNKKTGEKFS
ncbi:MAG: hypothetical protein GXP45_06320 [bacterium]|nr:hypothetical protein [bacterium]